MLALDKLFDACPGFSCIAPVTEPADQPHQLLDAAGVARCLDEIAEKIFARWQNESRLALVGIYRRGVPFAKALAERLRVKGLEVALGKIDITQYRDDLKTMTVLPKLEGSELDFDIEDSVVILCDEVVHTARTSRAALEELLDFGRPRSVELAALVDRVGRDQPLQPAYVGIHVDLPADERVSVRFVEGDGRDEVYVRTWEKKTA